MNLFKRAASAALALTLAAGMSGMPVFAAASAELENGTYKGTVHFHNGSNPASYSMCDSIFAHETDVVLTDDAAAVTVYVAYPIPAFADQGTDGTIKDVVMTLDGNDYTGVLDIDTKAVKTFDTTGSLFGINAGDELTTEAVTFSLPREAVDSFEEGIETKAYVNVVMNMNQDFVVKITDLAKSGDIPDATEQTEQSMEVTAEVEAVPASYSVTIPEAVAVGTLSAEADTSREYAVEVEAQRLGAGYVQVDTQAGGELVSEANKLAFTNTFGSQKTSESATLSGAIVVKGDDVKAAAAGNYTGTVNFTISYYAE